MISSTSDHHHSINAVILAGGLGTRLRPIISDKPKALAVVNNRPFLDYLLNQIESFGIKSVLICTGYMSEQIEARYGSEYQTVKLQYSREVMPLGTGGALALVSPLINSGQVLVLNGDSYCEIDYEDFYKFHINSRAEISIALAKVPDISRYGAVTADSNGLIIKFVEKGGNSGPGSINAGMYLMNIEVLQAIPADKPVSLEKDIFPRYLGSTLYGYHSGGNFIDIGIPSDFETAQKFNFDAQLQ